MWNEGLSFGVVKINGRTVSYELTVLSLVGHVGKAGECPVLPYRFP